MTKCSGEHKVVEPVLYKAILTIIQGVNRGENTGQSAFFARTEGEFLKVK
jgi:hypothetical protein